MTKDEKTYLDILQGKKDHNINFSDLKHLLESMDFKCSTKGDHFVYRRPDTPIINIQPEGNHAKAYQIRQIRAIIIEKKLEV